MRFVFNSSIVISGFISALIGITGSIAIVIQAIEVAGGTQSQVVSCIFAFGIGNLISSVSLSYYYKVPILTAWSTPGAVILVTSLAGIDINHAVGAFLFCSLLIFISGVTGLFAKIMNKIPVSIASAMLAGVIFQFCLKAFTSMDHSHNSLMIISAMLIVYLVSKVFLPRYALLSMFFVGVLLLFQLETIDLSSISFTLARLEYIHPEFSLTTMLSIGLPLFAVTMSSQNLPGFGVLASAGYKTPISPVVTSTGILGLVFACFGAFAFNLAAITAAMLMGDDVHKEKAVRYLAAAWSAFFYFLAALFSVAMVAALSLFPTYFIAALAGIALFSSLSSSLFHSFKEEVHREASLVTMLVTTSGLTFFNIGSAFWGLCFGLIVFSIPKLKKIK